MLIAAIAAPTFAAAQPATVPRRSVRICAGGDVSLGTNLDTSWVIRASKWSLRPVPALPDPAHLLAPLRPLLRDADIVLVNVEGAIGEGAAPPIKCTALTKHCFALRQPIASAAALRGLAPAGEVVGNVANNHAHDAGDEGLDSTIAHLTAAGVHVAGGDTLPAVVATASGDTVAFLGFSTSSVPDARDLDLVRRVVARTAARWPRVVVTAHLGAEGSQAQRTRDSTELFLAEDRGNAVAFARTAVAAGAGLVIGHGPHVVRAVEWEGDALVAYSLGNLVTYGPFSILPPLDRGMILCAALDGSGKATWAVLRPTRQLLPGRVRPDRSARALVLVDSLARLDFPSSAPSLMMEGVLLRRPTAPPGPPR